MKKTAHHCRMLLLAILLIASSEMARAQDSLSISVQGSLPKFQLLVDPTPANTIVLQTDWNITSALWGNVYVCVSMSAPMTGTGSNTDSIPATSVQANGTPILTGSTACGIPGALQVATGFIWFLGNKPSTRMTNGERLDTVDFRLAGYPANLSPDTYTGTITVIANAQY